jgi:hypothetical protein
MKLWRIPPKAMLLCVAVLLSALLVGGVAGSWIVPLAVALSKGGWAEVVQLPVSEHIFGQLPTWTTPESDFYVFKVLLYFAIPVICPAFGVQLALNWWRRSVVKWKWMTEEEVEEFFKRDPGF